MEGYTAACRDHGIELKETLIRHGDYKLDINSRLMAELLGEARGAFTAVLAASDDMAAGAVNCIQDHGLHVPGDISVIGFDGSQIADIVRPRLTTIRQPVEQISERTVELLLEMIEDEGERWRKDRMKTVVLGHELVERGSCRRIEA